MSQEVSKRIVSYKPNIPHLWIYKSLLLTIDPNFLAHPRSSVHLRLSRSRFLSGAMQSFQRVNTITGKSDLEITFCNLGSFWRKGSSFSGCGLVNKTFINCRTRRVNWSIILWLHTFLKYRDILNPYIMHDEFRWGSHTSIPSQRFLSSNPWPFLWTKVLATIPATHWTKVKRQKLQNNMFLRHNNRENLRGSPPPMPHNLSGNQAWYEIFFLKPIIVPENNPIIGFFGILQSPWNKFSFELKLRHLLLSALFSSCPFSWKKSPVGGLLASSQRRTHQLVHWSTKKNRPKNLQPFVEKKNALIFGGT